MLPLDIKRPSFKHDDDEETEMFKINPKMVGECGNCKYWAKSPKNEKLMQCAGNNGCEITGEKFFCANWEKAKDGKS